MRFQGFGHSFYRCHCGAAAFGLHTGSREAGATVTLYACTNEQLVHIESEMLWANTLDILRFLGYAK